MDRLTLPMLLLLLAVYVHADNNFGPPNNPCYKCSEFSDQGQGFMEYSITECCFYWECYRVNQWSTVTSTLRKCPEGQYWDPLYGPQGAPCQKDKPHPTCQDFCLTPPPPTHETGVCRWVPKQAQSHIYGYWSGATFIEEGRCKPRDQFDAVSCTCIATPTPCKCMADIWLIDDIEDHSCHGGVVFPSGAAVNFGVSVRPDGNVAAIFTGTPADSHLNDQLFSGLYAGCYVKKLSVGVFIKVSSFAPVAGTTRGVVYHSSCDDNFGYASYGIGVRTTDTGGEVIAVLGSHELKHTISLNKWYYVAFVYRLNLTNKKNFHLYVYDEDEEHDCRVDGNCDGPKDKKQTNKACIKARPCGLEVGFTGRSMNKEEFFDGEIGRVQVYHGLSIMGCEAKRKPKF